MTRFLKPTLAAAAALSFAVPAFALPSLPSDLETFYSEQGLDVSAITSLSCRLCHSGVFPNRRNLNGFGTDIQENVDIRADRVDFSPINDLDSDGDGFTNLEEFEAGTVPSDENSKP